MGGYDLISLSRHTPDLRWMAVDDHGKSIGSACFASDWYDYIEDKFMTFINVSVFANFNLISRYNQVFFRSFHKNDRSDISANVAHMD